MKKNRLSKIFLSILLCLSFIAQGVMPAAAASEYEAGSISVKDMTSGADEDLLTVEADGESVESGVIFENDEDPYPMSEEELNEFIREMEIRNRAYRNAKIQEGNEGEDEREFLPDCDAYGEEEPLPDGVNAYGEEEPLPYGVNASGSATSYTADFLINENTKTGLTFQQAVSEALKGNDHPTVKLTTDMYITSPVTIPEGKTINIDLGSHAVFMSRSAGNYSAMTSKDKNGHFFNVKKKATLILDGDSSSVGLTDRISMDGFAYGGTYRYRGGLLAGGYCDDRAGAIYMEEEARVYLNGMTIGNCAASGYGGAVFMQKSAKLYLTDSWIVSCCSGKDGGAVYVNGKNCEIRMDGDSEIYDCETKNSGGAIYSDGDNTKVAGSDSAKIRGNAAGNDGGAMYCNGSGFSFNFGNGTVCDNAAGSYGGALYLQKGDGIVEKVVITGNGAKYAGGINDNADGNLVSNVTITVNHAKEEVGGGGVRVDSMDDLSLSEKIIVRDNTSGSNDIKDDMCLQDGKVSKAYLRMSSYLASGSEVYVRRTGKPGRISRTSNHYYDVRQFKSDADGYHAAIDSENYLCLMQGPGPDYSVQKNEVSYESRSAQGNSAGFTYHADDGKDYPVIYGYSGDMVSKFFYSDGYFMSDPYKYDEHLSTFGYNMVIAAFNAFIGGESDYHFKGNNIKSFLSAVGCEEKDIYLSDSYMKKPEPDSIGFAIAKKEIAGTDFTLVPVVVRSAGYEVEWASNVTLNGSNTSINGGEASGFKNAASQVICGIESYIQNYGLTDKLNEGKVKFFVTGYSRGSATANLTAKYLIDTYGAYATEEPYKSHKSQVFCYGYEVPEGGTDVAESPLAQADNRRGYQAIHNIINKTDPVPLVAPYEMGFKRYGVDHFVPGGQVTGVRETVKQGSKDNNNPTVTIMEDNDSWSVGSDNYKTQKEKMLKQLLSIDEKFFFIDYFSEGYITMGKANAITNFLKPITINRLVQEDSKTLENWLPDMMKNIQTWKLLGKDENATRYNFSEYVMRSGKENPGDDETNWYQYGSGLQDMLRVVFGIAYGEHADGLINTLSGAIDKFDSFKVGTVIFGGTKGTTLLELYNQLIKNNDGWDLGGDVQQKWLDAFWSALNTTKGGSKSFTDNGLTGSEIQEIKEKLPALLGFVFRLANTDYDESGKKSGRDHGSSQMWMLGTFASNSDMIIMSHLPEVVVSWLRSYDSYYDNEQQKNYSYDKAQGPVIGDPHIDISERDDGSAFATITCENSEMICYSLTVNEKSSKDHIYQPGTGIELPAPPTAGTVYKYVIRAYGIRGNGKKEISKSPEVTAAYEASIPAYYTLKYRQDNGSGWTERKVRFNEKINLQASETKDYGFLKWIEETDTGSVTDENRKNENLTFNMPAKDVTVYPVYMARAVCVTEFGLAAPVVGESLPDNLTGFKFKIAGSDTEYSYPLAENNESADKNYDVSWRVWDEDKKDYVRVTGNAEAGKIYLAVAGVFELRDTEPSFSASNETRLAEGALPSGFQVLASVSYHGDFGIYTEYVTDGIDERNKRTLTVNAKYPDGEGEPMTIQVPANSVFTINASEVNKKAAGTVAFTGWTVADGVTLKGIGLGGSGGDVDLTQEKISFVMPDEDVVLTAEFAEVLNKVEVVIDPPRTGHPLPVVPDKAKVTIGEETFEVSCVDGFEIEWYQGVFDKLDKETQAAGNTVYYGQVVIDADKLKEAGEESKTLGGFAVSPLFDSSCAFVSSSDEARPIRLLGAGGSSENKNRIGIYFDAVVTDKAAIHVIYDPEELGLNVEDEETGKPRSDLSYAGFVASNLPDTVAAVTDTGLRELDVTWDRPDKFRENYVGSQVFTVTGNAIIPTDLTMAGDDGAAISSAPVKISVRIEGITPPAMPRAFPEGGVYTDSVLIALRCDTEDADIYYTLDGSSPLDENGLPTSKARKLAEDEMIYRTGDTDLRAQALVSGAGWSEVMIQQYVVEEKPEAQISDEDLERLNSLYLEDDGCLDELTDKLPQGFRWYYDGDDKAELTKKISLKGLDTDRAFVNAPLYYNPDPSVYRDAYISIPVPIYSKVNSITVVNGKACDNDGNTITGAAPGDLIFICAGTPEGDDGSMLYNEKFDKWSIERADGRELFTQTLSESDKEFLGDDMMKAFCDENGELMDGITCFFMPDCGVLCSAQFAEGEAPKPGQKAIVKDLKILEGSDLTLTLGGTETGSIVAQATYEGEGNKPEITFTSSDESVAVVEKTTLSGNEISKTTVTAAIRACNAGTAVIRAFCGDKCAQAAVTVKPFDGSGSAGGKASVTDLNITSGDSLELIHGQGGNIKARATYLGSGEKPEISFLSSDETIVTVEKAGPVGDGNEYSAFLRARGIGSAVVWVSCAGETKPVVVTVKPAQKVKVTSLEVSHDDLRMMPNEDWEITAKANYEDEGIEPKIFFKSVNEKVAQVKKMERIGAGEYSAVIRACEVEERTGTVIWVLSGSEMKRVNVTVTPDNTPDKIWVDGLMDTYPYTGFAVKPKVEVNFGYYPLYEKSDYTISYKNNTRVSVTGKPAELTVTGKGNFNSKQSLSFNIIPADLSMANAENPPYEIRADIQTAVYNGRKHNNIKPEVYINGTKAKLTSKDVTFGYYKAGEDGKPAGDPSECIEAGDYVIRIEAKKGSENFRGYVDVPLVILPKDSKAVEIRSARVKVPAVKYTGMMVVPVISLTSGKTEFVQKTAENADGKWDYEVEYLDDHTEPGKHMMILKGNGTSLVGQRRVEFKITGKRDLSKDLASIQVTDSEAHYASDGTMEIPYRYGGVKPDGVTVSYRIYEGSDRGWQGISLKEGRDYSISYKNNNKLSTDKTMASLTIKGKGAYTGTAKTVYYRIVKRDLSDLTVTVWDRKESKNPLDYRKTRILITDKNFTDQKYKAGKDYTVEWEAFESAPKSGTEVQLTITATDKEGSALSGITGASFRIIDGQKDIGSASVKFTSGDSRPYTGGEIIPSKEDIVVKLKGQTLKDSDYTIVGYYNLKNKGTATLLLRGNKDAGYGGYKIVKYKITPSPLEKLWFGRFSTL